MELRLKELRRAAGYTNRDDFAEVLGVNKYTYKSWETGAAMMSLEQAYNVAQVLGCTLEELVGRAPRKTYADPAQQALNEYYESSNSKGRGTIVDVARSVSSTDGK